MNDFKQNVSFKHKSNKQVKRVENTDICVLNIGSKHKKSTEKEKQASSVKMPEKST